MAGVTRTHVHGAQRTCGWGGEGTWRVGVLATPRWRAPMSVCGPDRVAHGKEEEEEREGAHEEEEEERREEAHEKEEGRQAGGERGGERGGARRVAEEEEGGHDEHAHAGGAQSAHALGVEGA